MIYRRIIEIHENKRTFGNSEKICSYAINKNGGIDSMENDILSFIKKLNNEGLININKFHELLDFDMSKLSLSNVSKNLETPIKNLEMNLDLISKELKHESV